MSEIRRLLNTKQSTDSTQNRLLASRQSRFLLLWMSVNNISLIDLQDVGESHVGGGAEEGRDAVICSCQRVRRPCVAVVPVDVFGYVRKVHVHLVHSQQRDLEVPVNDPVSLKVVIVLSKRVYELLCYLQPSRVEEELQQGEDGDVKIKVVAGMTLGGVKKLPTNQTSEEEGVNSKSNNLSINEGDADPVVAKKSRTPCPEEIHLIEDVLQVYAVLDTSFLPSFRCQVGEPDHRNPVLQVRRTYVLKHFPFLWSHKTCLNHMVDGGKTLADSCADGSEDEQRRQVDVTYQRSSQKAAIFVFTLNTAGDVKHESVRPGKVNKLIPPAIHH